MTKQKPLDFYR